jgi:tRNA-splicing endonuclease subunit Sen2
MQRMMAEFVGDVVLVRDTESMRRLWEEGYFGKGLLSRSEPIWRFGRSFGGVKRRKRGKVEQVEVPKEPMEKVPEWEDMQLDLQETLYLVQVGCLDVQYRPLAFPNMIPVENKSMSVQECWRYFATMNGGSLKDTSNRFIVNYVAYHYFRSRGWVVRSGLKFGVDYVLYRQGPHQIHSEFAVLVIPDHGDALPPSDFVPPVTSWLSLLSNARVGSQVKKEIILCYVVIPTKVDLSTPEGISDYRVNDTILRRWVPNRSR